MNVRCLPQKFKRVLAGRRLTKFFQRLGVALSFIVVSCSSLWAAQLQSIDYEVLDQHTLVILHLDSPARFSRHDLPASRTLPQRCYLDFVSTRPHNALPWQINIADQRLKTVRIGVHGKTLRVVLDLQQGQVCQVISEPSAADVRLQIYSPNAEPAVKAESPSVASAPERHHVVVLNDAAESPSATRLVEPPSVVPQPEGGDHSLNDPFVDVALWGELQAYGAEDLNHQGAEDDNLYHLQGRLGVDVDKTFAQDSLNGRLAVEVDRLYYDAPAADEETEVTLYEAYVALNRPRWDLSLGKQRVRWGKSDQLSPMDCINPEDLRQFVTTDLEERKQPSWLARLRTYGERFSFEAIVSPWFEESEMDYFDSNWALYRNLRQSILNHPALSAEAKAYAAHLRVDEEEPTVSLENMSGALRMLWQTEQADFALSYRYGWETLPTIISFPVKNIRYDGDPDTDPAPLLASAVLTDEAVKARFERQKIVGVEWETTLDLIGFRGEIAYIDKVAFLASDLTSRRREVGQLVTGIDYTSETEWYFNVQTSWMRIFHYDSDILYFEEDTVALLGEVRKSLWRGNLDVATRFNYTLTDGSSYVQPNMTLKYFPNTECEVGVNIFSGDGETWLGSYDQADQVYARLNVVF